MCKQHINPKKGLEKAIILSQREIAKNIYHMVIKSNDISKAAKAGQFVNLYCEDGVHLLPRPISICEIDKNEGTITIVYAVVGKGTKEFSRLKQGEEIMVLGPLGNGFPIYKDEKVNIIVGGGVGTPPLLELVKGLKGDNHIFIGFRSEPYLVSELMKYGTVHVATDDGSVGYKGTTIDLLKEKNIVSDRIFACGPTPMLKALQSFAIDNQLDGYLSLEERMGCGFGACVGCVCKIRVGDIIENKRVCHDGPVFNIREVVFDE